MRGIIGYGAFLPYGRLDRWTIVPFVGSGGGRGTRSVAGYDEDTTTLGVEAARLALRSAEVLPRSLWFATVAPAHLYNTNSATIHAAQRPHRDVRPVDFGGPIRSRPAAPVAALHGAEPTLV